MAVNKNFVVKNGLEVNESLILANASTNMVGIGTTGPSYLLDVAGGIGATDAYVTGFTTLTKGLQVGTSGSVFYVNDSNNAVGIGTSVPTFPLEVHSSVSAGTTALYVFGDAYLTGNLDVIGDIVYDEVTGRNIYISGLSTFVGVSTFKSDVYIDGDLNVTGDIVYDEVTGRNLNISGIATVGTQFYPPVITTVQRDALTVSEGCMIFNTTTKKIEFYDGTSWNTLPGMSLGLTVALDG